MFVDPNRLVEIEDCSQIYVGLGFAGIRSFTTTGEPVLLIDPVHLADVYDTRSDKTAHYLRRHGVFVADFGGDSQAPVLWSDPYLVLPTSMQLPKDFAMPRATRGLVPAISCDSGSFMFLPLSDGVPGDVRRHLVSVERDSAVLELPSGAYTVYYEQFPPPQPNMAGLFRNIVAIRQPAPEN